MCAKRVWVNFKELRSKLRFEDVLRHYKIEVRRKGDQHQGFCPLPGHGENRKSPSFSANLERGIFHCFGCGAKGNVLEFACLMAGADPKDGNALRAVAVELQQTFFPRGENTRQPSDEARVNEPRSAAAPVKVNEPLNFELKDLDAGHPYLASRGITRETALFFGLGACSRGFLKDRLAIPLHGQDGKLIGYAGRVLDDGTVSEDNPRYRFPSRREHGGAIYTFDKSLFVYNGHRVKAPCDDLVVVQGFPAVWWLHQNGYPASVALMGAECSEEQTEAVSGLLAPSGRLWLMTDGTDLGDGLARIVLGRFARRHFVRWVRLSEGEQPTDLDAAKLKQCLTT